MLLVIVVILSAVFTVVAVLAVLVSVSLFVRLFVVDRVRTTNCVGCENVLVKTR